MADAVPLLVEDLGRHTGLERDTLAAWFAPLLTGLWRGRQPFEPAFWAEITSLLDPPADPRPGWWRLQLMSRVVPLAGAAAARRWAVSTAGVWLLANHWRPWLEPSLRWAGVWQVLSGAFISSETRVLVPDPAAFAALRHAAPGVELAYVDTDEEALETARALGFVPVHADLDGAWMTALDTWLGTQRPQAA